MTNTTDPGPLSPDYPFDQYQRYSDVRLVVQALAGRLGRASLRILDVGGTKLARRFLPEHEVLVSNLIPAPEAVLQASGVDLPFGDGAVDLVITVDTLEHIPPDLRAAFVAELARVAGHAVIITGPFDNGGVNVQAELLLDDYLNNVLAAPYPFLTEHQTFGLPDAAATCAVLADAGLATVTAPSGYTHRWLPLMLIRFGLYQVENGLELANVLEALYNRNFFWRDHVSPSYRQVIVGVRNADVLGLVEGLFAGQDEGEADLSGVTALWQGLHATRALADRDDEIAALRARVDELEELVAAYESGHFMRTMRRIHRARGRLGL